MKGLLATVPQPNPTPFRCLDAQPSSHPVTPDSVTEPHPPGGTFRPYAFGLLTLALAIALWGFGYRLSRYNPHPSAASRASMAKLWDKQLDSPSSVTSILNSRAHLTSGLRILWISIERPQGMEASVALDIDQRDERPSRNLRRLSPSRSPPFLASLG
jgi:hypothetical protein